VRLNYLAVRLDWSADYIARVNADGSSLDLTGWLTLANDGATGFANAPTAVVAGRLSRVPVDRPRVFAKPVRRACWPGQTTHSGWRETERLREIVVTAQRRMMMAPPPPPPPPPVIEGALGDYHLYRLTEPATLAARETKQVMFLHLANAPFDKALVCAGDWATARPQPADVVLRLDNTKARGLGQGLPAGHVQMRQRQAAADGRELLVGTARLDRDVPVGEPFELRVGADADVQVTRMVTAHQVGAPDRWGVRRIHESFVVHVTNAGSDAVTVEIRHLRRYPLDFSVTAESEAHGLKSGAPVWRVVVPAGGAHDLSYSVSFLR
jgi:hypothetical protein